MTKMTKFEFQACVFQKLKEAGYLVRGGIKVPGFYEYEADLVLYDEEKNPEMVIEIKTSLRALSTKRIKKLSRLLDCSWLQVRGPDEVLDCVALVKQKLKKFGRNL